MPREALPPALKRTFDAGELAKERFRRASSLGPGLPPLDAGSSALQLSSDLSWSGFSGVGWSTAISVVGVGEAAAGGDEER